MNNDEKHIDLREKLQKLPRVKARDGFENELLRRINLLEPDPVRTEQGKRGLFEILFGKKSLAWTIPATSLVVIGIVVFAVYFNIFKTADRTSQTSESVTGNEKFPAASDVQKQETTKSSIPGKDIVNDLDIGKTPSPDKRDQINKGFNETYIQRPSVKDNQPKENVIDSKKESTPPEKGNEVRKTENNPSEIEKAVEKPKKKEELGIENETKALDPEKKIFAPMIKETDKKKADKENETGIKTKEEGKKRIAKYLTKENLENLKKKIIDN